MILVHEDVQDKPYSGLNIYWRVKPVLAKLAACLLDLISLGFLETSVATHDCPREKKMHWPSVTSEHLWMFNSVAYSRLVQIEILMEDFSFTVKVGYVSLGGTSFLGQRRTISLKNISIIFSTTNEFSCISLSSNIHPLIGFFLTSDFLMNLNAVLTSNFNSWCGFPDVVGSWWTAKRQTVRHPKLLNLHSS